MISARKTAVRALVKVEQESGYSNLVIDAAIKESELDKRDSALATMLFYGVLERRITLDYIIQKYLNKPLQELSSAVIQTLRIGLYQIIYMDRIPDSAAVNESVNLIKSTRQRSAAGLVNAVLRAFLRDNKEIVYPTDQIERLSIEYSFPLWIVESFINDYGFDNCVQILKKFSEPSKVTVRVNITKTTAQNLINEFTKAGVSAEHSDFCENAIILKNTGSIESLYGYKEGLFHVQDVASQLAAKALMAKSGDRVIDVCAAPGGKSFTIAQEMGDCGEVLSLDLFEHKIKLIRAGAYRLGLKSIKADINDASAYNSKYGKFKRVLCDLPCSGLGILGKKPEIRYKNVALLDNLDNLQYDLLCTSSQYVEVSGILIYSTCTLRHKENKQVAERFLAEHTDFEPLDIMNNIERAIDEPANMITFMPHIHQTDGFFIAAFIKTR